MGLQFKNTCPLIDVNLDSIKEWVNQYLDDLIGDIQPNISEEYKTEMLDKYNKLIFDEEIEPKIQELRDLNSEMRDFANEQLTEIEEEKENAEEEIERLQAELDNITVTQ